MTGKGRPATGQAASQERPAHGHGARPRAVPRERRPEPARTARWPGKMPASRPPASRRGLLPCHSSIRTQVRVSESAHGRLLSAQSGAWPAEAAWLMHSRPAWARLFLWLHQHRDPRIAHHPHGRTRQVPRPRPRLRPISDPPRPPRYRLLSVTQPHRHRGPPPPATRRRCARGKCPANLRERRR